MKFKSFLTESIEDYFTKESLEILMKVKEECKPFLEISDNRPLLRGMTLPRSYGKKSIRFDRKPKGSSQMVFDWLNDILHYKGHVTRDNALIGTGSFDKAMIFGSLVYGVFPIGNVKYTWIRAGDVNLWDRKTKWPSLNTVKKIFNKLEPKNKIMGVTDQWEGLTKEEMVSKIDEYFTTNKGFDKAYKNGYEIWFRCREYYYISIGSPDVVKLIRRFLSK